MNKSFLVGVNCITFNHAPFIEYALNGFCVQKTSFSFVCTIVDDFSTDGEQYVIENYLSKHFNLEDKTTVQFEETDDYKLVFAQHRKNLNCFFVVYFFRTFESA